MIEQIQNPTHSVSAFEGFSRKVNHAINAMNNGIITQKEACENIELAIIKTQQKIKYPPHILYIIEE